MLHHRKEKLRQTLIKLLVLYMNLSEKKSKRSVWVRPIFTVEQRLLQGDSDNLIPMLKTTDEPLHFNYLRVDSTIFEELILLVGPHIEKEVNIREPIASHTRLQICLRYLASGDSMRSIGYAFRVSPNTVSMIIHETCNVIWEKLKDIVLPIPSQDAWLKVAADFESIWNFPHCLGAIDGKHIAIEVINYLNMFILHISEKH